MKILLFGSEGQVGWELQRSLAPLGQLVALTRLGSGDLCGDLLDLDGVAQSVRAVRPDVIVNAAAYTAVDQAESESEKAFLVNAAAPEVLSREAEQIDAWMFHYSTDYVYRGDGDQPWGEDDPTSPVNRYGESKLAGDTAILASGSKHIILRTSWVYAARGSNFLRTMLGLAFERDELRVVNDQFGAPTGADLIADVTAHCVRAVRQASDATGTSREPSGVYNVAASGVTTWYEYALRLVVKAREMGYKTKVSATDVSAVASEAYSTVAKRPRNSRLDTSKLQAAFGLTLPDWTFGVDRAVTEILTGPLETG